MAAPAFDLFEAAPEPMAVLAPDGALVRANAAFCAAFRHPIGPGRPPWGRWAPPNFINDRRRFETGAAEGRRIEWIEQRLPDGASLVIAHDVTRRAAAAAASARAKTVLFATLTHELRTPLNGILGMAGLLQHAELAPAQREYVAAIRHSGEHLLDLITEILDYSRLEAGGVTLESIEFDPEQTVQSVAELLSPKARAKGLEIAVLTRAGAPERVRGDDGRLRQILFNLAGNAVKFTERGGVVLELSARSGGLLRFAVRDTGPGVPQDMQAAIFEEFAQLGDPATSRHGGAGLGLAIVRRLARAMGGEAGLVSRPGAGAVFWVDLPLEPVDGWRVRALSLTGIRAAIVNASPLLAGALGAALKALGATVVDAEDQPDVALVDNIPSLSAEAIAALSARAVIALAPQEDRSAIVAARALGVKHYLIKPARRRSLGERVLIALGDRRGLDMDAAEEEDEPAQTPLGARVLLAEDNPINALLARTLLQRQGCSVDVVGDGEEAVAALSERHYDLVFLDLRMPRLDGMGAARRIRALGPDKARTPLVALTADSSDEDRVAALAAGFDEFVAKPIDMNRLADVTARFTRAAKAATLAR